MEPWFIDQSSPCLHHLRLLITFSGAVRKMFRTLVIFGGTMDNYIYIYIYIYIYMERL